MSFYLPAICADNENDYDKVLERYELKKAALDIKDFDKEPKRYSLGFDHEYFPNLDGTWELTKKTLGRKINPLLKKPIANVHCNARLPFESRDIEKKEVIISARGADFFKVNAKHTHTKDIYFDPNLDENIEYHNFGFKAVLDPYDLTYSYTVKLDDYLHEQSLVRQLWLNGKLKYEFISPRRIVARGYEIEYTPECIGYVFDEIEFTLVKIKDAHFGPLAPAPGIPIFGQSAYAAEPILPEEKEIKGIKKPILDSAKDKSGFKPAAHYKPLDTVKPGVKVPGLW